MSNDSITFVDNFGGPFLFAEMPRKISARDKSYNSMIDKYRSWGREVASGVVSRLQGYLEFLPTKDVPNKLVNSRAIKLRKNNMLSVRKNADIINSKISKTMADELVEQSIKEEPLFKINEEQVLSDVADAVETVSVMDDDPIDVQKIDFNDEADLFKLPRGGNAAKIDKYENSTDDNINKVDDSKEVRRSAVSPLLDHDFSKLFIPSKPVINVSNDNKVSTDRDVPIVVEDRKDSSVIENKLADFEEDKSVDIVDASIDNQKTEVKEISNNDTKSTINLLATIQEKLQKYSEVSKIREEKEKALAEQEEEIRQSDADIEDKTRIMGELLDMLDGSIAAEEEKAREFELGIDEKKRLVQNNKDLINQIDSVIESSHSISKL